MDKYMLPFFFNQIKPSVYFNNKNTFNQKNIVFSSKQPVFLSESNCFLPIDITSVDQNPLSTFCHISKSSKNQNIILNYSNSTEVILFNQFTGLNWPFREVLELFGLKSAKMLDNRNLLLDYSSIVNPLKKAFPCEGVEEVYFNFFNQKIKKHRLFFIEL